jgi:hypothetical protein
MLSAAGISFGLAIHSVNPFFCSNFIVYSFTEDLPSFRFLGCGYAKKPSDVSVARVLAVFQKGNPMLQEYVSL